MITLKGSSAIYEGTTNDSKPTTDIEVNTLFHELDTNKWYYFTTSSTWVEVPNTGGGGGSSFTPTEEQLAAMNSGITSEDVTQIGTNENDISTIQGKLTAHTAGGSNYDVINGIRVYVSATAPTGDIPTGSLWIGG